MEPGMGHQMMTTGIIFRTSGVTSDGRYAFSPFPRSDASAAGASAIIGSSLSSAPHFPNMSILDCFSSALFYQTYESPQALHVYDLFSRLHFALSFPHPSAPVAGAFVPRSRTHFKLLVVCVDEHSNPFFSAAAEPRRPKPLAFHVYSSERRSWTRASVSPAWTSSDLLPSQRRPVHAEEGAVVLDLTPRFLARFAASEDRVEPVPKLPEPARYDECRGQLQCARVNPQLNRAELYQWNPAAGAWVELGQGRGQLLQRKLAGICPEGDGLLLLRSTDKDAILVHDVRRGLEWVILEGKGAGCGPRCFLREPRQLLEAALRDVPLTRSACRRIHPYENADAHDGEIFVVGIPPSALQSPFLLTRKLLWMKLRRLYFQSEIMQPLGRMSSLSSSIRTHGILLAAIFVMAFHTFSLSK